MAPRESSGREPGQDRRSLAQQDVCRSAIPILPLRLKFEALESAAPCRDLDVLDEFWSMMRMSISKSG